MTFWANHSVYRLITVLTDVGCVLAAWGVAAWLRYAGLAVPWREQFHAEFYWVLGAYTLVSLVILFLFGAYRPDRLRPLAADMHSVTQAAVVIAVTAFAAVAMLKLHGASRLLVGYVVTLHAGLLIVSRWVIARVVTFYRHRRQPCRVLAVWSSPAVYEVLDRLRLYSQSGIQLVGWLSDETAPVASSAEPAGQPEQIAPSWLGPISSLTGVLREEVVDEVLVSLSLPPSTLRATLLSCQNEGKPVHIILDGLGPTAAHRTITSVYGLNVLSLSGPAHGAPALIVKRFCDLLGASLALIVLAPALLTVAVLVRLDSPGPVYFRQERVGLNGRLFRIAKFRTMVAQAESLKAGVMHLNEAQGPLFKVKEDPRITRVGRFLRRANIDELPQLLNVIRGEMSLVGPRPLATDEARECREWHKRHSVKPGLTGMWQVTEGRHQLDFEDSMRLDLEYVDKWSLLLDLKLVLRTLPSVFRLKGM